MMEKAELSGAHMDPMSTGACGKAALPLKEGKCHAPPRQWNDKHKNLTSNLFPVPLTKSCCWFCVFPGVFPQSCPHSFSHCSCNFVQRGRSQKWKGRIAKPKPHSQYAVHKTSLLWLIPETGFSGALYPCSTVWPLLTTGCRSCTEFAKAQDQGLPNLLCLDYFREPAALFQFGLAVGTPSSF